MLEESLYHYPKGQKASIFIREKQNFKFVDDAEKKKKEMISQAVAENQLFFSVACTLNYLPCIQAMKWFREQIVFSRDFDDIPISLIQNYENSNMLNSIKDYAKQADLGIKDMSFELDEHNIDDDTENLGDDLKDALDNLLKALTNSSGAESNLKIAKIKTKSYHNGRNENGEEELFALDLSDESDGTRKLMSLAPHIEKTLENGGVLIVDELEKELHPMLLEYIIAKFQSPNSNKNNAQIIFTTHNTEILSMHLLRKDQIYFTEKSNEDGVSELYSLASLSPATNENVRKGYLLGRYGATPMLDIEQVW